MSFFSGSDWTLSPRPFSWSSLFLLSPGRLLVNRVNTLLCAKPWAGQAPQGSEGGGNSCRNTLESASFPRAFKFPGAKLVPRQDA